MLEQSLSQCIVFQNTSLEKHSFVFVEMKNGHEYRCKKIKKSFQGTDSLQCLIYFLVSHWSCFFNF